MADTDLQNQLVAVLDDTYLYSLKNPHTGCSEWPTQEIITYIYANYASILSTDISTNDICLFSTHNSEDPIESLIKQLNECENFAAAAGKPVTDTQSV